ncbi:MAG: hypothetical protein IT384_30250 [Deltaproteobacteria bacterium]|nr:hypothetical protein [Deltaproteobacteria bacterium]
MNETSHNGSAGGGLGGEALLLFLEATVQGDGGLPGFRGAIGFGVRSGGNESWLRMSFWQKGETQLLDHRPTDVDAWMLLDEITAMRFLGKKVEGHASAPKVGGDAKLMTRFVERYLEQRSMLDLRSGLPRAR